MLDPRINNYAGLYRLPGTFDKNWNFFLCRLVEPSTNLSIFFRILKHLNTCCLGKYHVTMDLGGMGSV